MNHCFPKGYKLIESNKDNKDNILQDEYFFFSLENVNRLNPENRRIYYIATIINEPINLYLNIKYDNKIPAMPKKNYISLNNVYIPKGFCLSMIKPFPFEAKNLMRELLDYFRGGQITIPIEKIIESVIYGIPKPLRAYFYISCKLLTIKQRRNRHRAQPVPLRTFSVCFTVVHRLFDGFNR